MKLFVSKLSDDNSGGNPKGIKLYIIKNKDKEDNKIEEEVGEIEEVEEIEDLDEIEEDNEDLKTSYKKKLIEEFLNGRLRQGWGYEDGIHSLNLQEGLGSIRGKNDRIQPTEKWVCDFMNIYETSQEEAIGRFWIISKLLDMTEGSIIFVPNIPSNDKFSVATVNKKGYEFSQMEDYEGHGHIIHVKDVKIYSYGDDTLPKKIWSFPPAVVRIRNDSKFKTFLEKSYFKR